MNRNDSTNGQTIDKSFRYSRAETMALSCLLQSLKAENDERLESKSNYSSSHPAREGVSIPRLEAMMIGEMQDIFSTREQVAKQKKVENAILVDHFGDHGVYTGDLRKGEPHTRYGTMTYEDGRRYEGNWINGRYHGKGYTCFASGDFYTGDYKSDHMHGQGTYCWKDGRAYAGEFCEDERQGHGVYSWPAGSSFTGSFVGGQMHGSGIYQSVSGNRYEGEFRCGQWHGCGCLVSVDGQRYEGQFRLGLKHGDGQESRLGGTCVHKGRWHNGEPAFERSKKYS
jgi:hypothetical protein